MHIRFSIIEGNYLRDILAQPQAVDDTVSAFDITPQMEQVLERFHAQHFERLALTGMGSSFWALQPLHIHLLNRGWTSILMETSELIHTVPSILDARTLLIAVSQSGRSIEIIRLLERKQPGCCTLAVTNTPDSPLARLSDAAVLTHAGAEFTVASKTYLATLAALEWVAALLTAGSPEQTLEELRKAPAILAAYLEQWRAHVAEAEALLSGARSLFFLGRGASLAAAGTGALITKESTHFHAEGMSAAAFRHGPLEMAGPGVYALVFAGEARTAALNQKLVADIRQAGGRAALAGEDAESRVFRLPRAAAAICPMLEILPVEMITLALAAMCGREAGKFERATKVTAAE